MASSLTLAQVEDKVVDHYATEFQTDPNTIFATTDLKARFNFTTPASWAAEAEPLSLLFGVRIAQGDMNSNTTVDKLTRLIKKALDSQGAGVAAMSAMIGNVMPAKKARKKAKKAVKRPAKTAKSKARKRSKPRARRR